MQFFIASHSENVIKSVELPELLALKGISKPRRLSIISGEVRPVPDSSIANAEITALRLGNALVVNATLNPIILFLEGEDDLRILEAWANVLGTTGTLQKCVPTFMRGGDKEAMFRQADITFKGLRRLVPNVERFYLFDFDQKENTWHPDPNNKVCFEWKRKNIENYLFVPNVWLRAGVDVSGISTISFSAKLSDFVATFFENQTLILPKGQTYGQFSQGAFASNDGKQLLFGDNKESLYNQLIHNFKLSVPRSKVALNMLPSEIHQDVVDFFARLETLVANTTQSEI